MKYFMKSKTVFLAVMTTILGLLLTLQPLLPQLQAVMPDNENLPVIITGIGVLIGILRAMTSTPLVASVPFDVPKVLGLAQPLPPTEVEKLTADLTFDAAFDRLIGHEGKFSNDRRDRGNWSSGTIGIGRLIGTKYGLAGMTYPSLDIENLTLEDAKAIYKRDWWDAIAANNLPPAIVFQLWDTAINSGMDRAKKLLQQAVGVTPDGKFGKQTHAAIESTHVNDVLLRFNGYRLLFMTDISTWPTYGKGWARRVANNLLYAADDN